MNKNEHDYEITGYDEWGNPLAKCPVCGFIFKCDGVLKHIARYDQLGDVKHKKWLQDNR